MMASNLAFGLSILIYLTWGIWGPTITEAINDKIAPNKDKLLWVIYITISLLCYGFIPGFIYLICTGEFIWVWVIFSPLSYLFILMIHAMARGLNN